MVDAANVVGSVPDGWWRDRAGPLDAALVHLVLEGAAKAAEVPDHPRLRVVRAAADGDSTIVALVATLTDEVTVVTADRGLRARLGPVATIGPGTLLARLP